VFKSLKFQENSRIFLSLAKNLHLKNNILDFVGCLSATWAPPLLSWALNQLPFVVIVSSFFTQVPFLKYFVDRVVCSAEVVRIFFVL